jgi:hypothetical protein
MIELLDILICNEVLRRQSPKRPTFGMLDRADIPDRQPDRRRN